MNSTEKIATFSLANLFALRMLGLFMILPVFSVYAQHLAAATPTLIGLTLGIYGLTQASLQLPFGLLSERLGRKLVIGLGLSLFILGSIVAALSDSIYGVLIGRSLQGTAAIGSVILALLADLVRDSERSQSLAIVGIIIVITFFISLTIAPVLNIWIGIKGIFWLSALLAAVGLAVLYWVVPNPSTLAVKAETQPTSHVIKSILSNQELLRLDIGIFVLHAIFTALFVVIPVLLTSLLHLGGYQQLEFYLVTLLLAVICALPLIRVAEYKQRVRLLLLSSISILGLSLIGLLVLPLHLVSTGILLWCFFIAFVVLEASLPATVSKLAPPGSRGAALGVYSTLQFLGIFFGGSMAGALFGHGHFLRVLSFCLVLTVIWLLVASGMENPPQRVKLT